jgi:hypothetical protein
MNDNNKTFICCCLTMLYYTIYNILYYIIFYRFYINLYFSMHIHGANFKVLIKLIKKFNKNNTRTRIHTGNISDLGS